MVTEARVTRVWPSCVLPRFLMPRLAARLLCLLITLQATPSSRLLPFSSLPLAQPVLVSPVFFFLSSPAPHTPPYLCPPPPRSPA